MRQTTVPKAPKRHPKGPSTKLKILALLLALTLTATKTASSQDEETPIGSERVNLSQENSEKLSQTVDPKAPFFCTNGANPKDLSIKAYLKGFAEGPCHPIAFFPGVPGSKLIAMIDCPVLKERNSKIFKTCGWSSCKPGHPGTPKAEYQVWVPGIFSPMSLTKGSKRATECYSSLLEPRIVEKTINGEKVLALETDKLGVKVRALGDTPESSSYKSSKCALNAIQSFFPGWLPFNIPLFDGYRKTINRFLEAGYLSGLTLQALPYNFEKLTRDNRLGKKFEGIIDNMYSMVGKSVAVMAHSFGNSQAYYNILRLKKKNKSYKVKSFFAMSPPFLGNQKSTWRRWGATSEFHFDFGLYRFGLTPNVTRRVLSISGVGFDMFSRKHYSRHASSKWIKAIKLRIAQENGKKLKRKNHKFFDIFPHPDTKCFNDEYAELRSTKCTTGLYEIQDLGLVNGEKVTTENLPKIVKKYAHDPKMGDLMKERVEDNTFIDFENPGVQTNIIYISLLKTPSRVFYDQDPKIKSKAGKFYEPDRAETVVGDGTVSVSTSITPGVRWGMEFEDGVRGAKPVNFVELCSLYNRRSSIFDDLRNFEVKKSAYFGIDCTCKKGYFGHHEGNCGHGIFTHDEHLINFLLSSVVSRKKGKISGRFAGMSEGKLKNYRDKCWLFRNI